MTQFNSVEQRRQKTGVRRMKKANLKIDMTPMVDLGFLLIAFFIFTTEISKPTVTNLYMTDDRDSTGIPDSKSLTFLLGNNEQLFYYYGREKEAVENNQVYATSYAPDNGAGKIIREKQFSLDQRFANRKELTILIKPGKSCSYKNVVDMLDEMMINGVTRYSLVDPGKYDGKYLGVKD